MRTSLSFMFRFANKKRWLLLGYSALILECLTPIIAVLLQRDLIDKVFIDRQYQEFLKLITLYAIFFFGPKLCFTVRKVTFFHISYHMQMKLTEKFLNKIYKLPTEIFNKEHTGKLLKNIRNDINDACNVTVNQILSESVRIILSIIFLSWSIARISFKMLFFIVIVAVIYYFLLNKFGEKTKKYSQKVRREKGNVSVNIEESISAVREIVAYNRQNWQMDIFEKKFHKYFQSIMKESLYKIKIFFVSEPFLYGTKLIVIFLGGLSSINSKVSLGEFVVSFTLVDQLVTALGELFKQGLIGKRLTSSVGCIKAVMNKENIEFGKERFQKDIESIKFNNVTFRYSSESSIILDNLCIDFPIGKKIALVGGSGSGKSTIAQLLLRFYTQENGSIEMNETSIEKYGEGYKDKVSIVFQQPHFIPSSIKENLTFNREYDNSEIIHICKKMKCFDFIQELPQRFDTEVGERGTSLSGGQKQRLALARALLKNTEILILDEATSALDTETEYIVQENIDKLRKGKTTIIIAHRLSTISNADIIYVLDKGRISAKGNHEELMLESSKYRKLYTQQKLS